MDITEVVQLAGVRASALRFYESKGLIRSTSRAGARRQFGPDVLDRLALIALGRAAGLTLDEIGRMIGTDGSVQVDRGILRSRAAEFDSHINQLTAMRDGLLHAADCRAKDHLSCPTFRRLLHSAASRTLRVAGRTPRISRS